ncbi:MAG TPA: MarR family transcriptional regulator [Streptomyces sp.]
MTTTDGRTIGLAHYAGRAVAERVLDRHGLAFFDHLALRAAHAADGPLTLEELTDHLTTSLKGDPVQYRETVTSLAAKGYLDQDAALRLTLSPAGRALFTTATAEIAEVSARIYAGIPEEDLTTAGRVLGLVTQRANAELTALTAPRG